MTISPELKKKITQRAKRLGDLLARSNLPRPIIDEILEQSPHLSLLEIDLLIDALAREQEEWSKFSIRLEKVKKRLQEDNNKFVEKQKKIVRELVEETIAEAEKKAGAEIKKSLD